MFATLVAGLGLGGVIVYLLQTFRPTKKDQYDAQAKARDELWKELATVRAQVAILQAQVQDLSKEKFGYLKQIGVLEVEKEQLLHKLDNRDSDIRELRDELTSVTLERDELKLKLDERFVHAVSTDES